MTLKLTAETGGGSVALTAPNATTDNLAVSLKLPVADGSANQILKTDGSGQLGWATDNSGISLSGSTNNTIATVTGANALQGEANLTFDGSTLGVTGTVAASDISLAGTIFHTGDTDNKIEFGTDSIVLKTGNSNRLEANNYGVYVASGLPLAFLASSGDTPNIKSGGSNNRDLLFTTGNAERLRITSAGKVLIGTNTPQGNANADDLVVSSGGTTGISIRAGGTSYDSNIFFARGTSGADEYRGWITYDHTDQFMTLGTNGQEIVRASTGTFGIGCTPSRTLHVKGPHDCHLAIQVPGTTQTSALLFGDSGDDDIGAISYSHSDNSMRFVTNTSERFRITSAGHTLFSGMTDANDTRNLKGISMQSPAGISFQNFGANGSRNWRIRPDDLGGWSDLDFSCAPTDGSTDIPDAAADNVLSLQGDTKDVVVANGNLVIGTSGKGIDFSATSDGSGTDNSEVFDDYEEGTWTPSMDGLSNTPSFYNLVGKYVKIGSVVKCQGFIQIGATNPTFSNTSHVFKVSGLPYTASGSGYLRVIGNVAWQGIDWVGASQSTYGHNDDTIIQAAIDDGGTKTTFRTMGKADYYMGELKNTVFHNNGWILEWDFSYMTI